ncbi:putative selenium delivery protein YdfZ [Erwinia sp. HR93]|uniref:putative selenium delivery protein YdfZ n=1 Tax=Erwinia sp. HR93 TaxID=3094840 RepID=UPI002ADEAAD1|nr:putative selenium delivery protein YdfZ [Erwinia sp. HR93]MEA1065030.1 putative selenium delivery protein YdfZ [Erwinia sp. HR93]
MMTYDRNRNPITIGSRVLINGSEKTGVNTAIHAEGLTAEPVRRAASIEVGSVKGNYLPVELIRLGLH